MLQVIRQSIAKKPWIGWAVAALCLCLALLVYFRRTGSSDPYTPERMTEMVTIKFTDTGDEIEIPRGRLDVELRQRGAHLDPSQGIMNPKTGQPTGFPFNKKEWDAWIARINQEKKTAGQLESRSGGLRPGEAYDKK